MRAIFQKKGKNMLNKGKKGQNIWKFGRKCAKIENILKKGTWLHAIIARNKLLEKALELQFSRTTCSNTNIHNNLGTIHISP